MFKDKKDFKTTFARRLEEKYGRSVDDSHITERYDILGEMVRDYAGYEWRTCRQDSSPCSVRSPSMVPRQARRPNGSA